jgi:predicted ATPase
MVNRILPLALLVAPLSCTESVHTVIEHVYDACAPVVVAIDDGATDAERRSVVEAVAMWNERAGTRLTLDPTDGADRLLVRFEAAAPAFFGLYDDDRAEVVINTQLRDHRARTITIAHELGHAFGLVHVDRSIRTSLMNPGNLSQEATLADIEALWSLWGACPPPSSDRDIVALAQ